MGKVEKVIVLSVLFLIALILVVSLTVDDPLDKSRIVEAGAPPGRSASATNAQPNPQATPASGLPVAALPDTAKADPKAPGLLSTGIQPIPETGPPAAPTDPALQPVTAGQPVTQANASGLPPGALLKTLDGLQDSILMEMKLYTWKEGDSYRSIANKYYGDWTKFTVLRRSNEGRNDVQPGENVFIPVFDSEGGASTASSAERIPGGAKPSKPNGGAKKVAATSSTGSRVHVVKEGESLWKIAKEELGSGSRWEEIFELNKDVIPPSKMLHKGLRLRIP